MKNVLIQKPVAITALYELCEADAPVHAKVIAAAQDALGQAEPWPTLHCAIEQLANANELTPSAQRFVTREIETMEPTYHYRATGDHWTVYGYEASTGTEDWTANVDTETWAQRIVTLGNEQVLPDLAPGNPIRQPEPVRLAVYVEGGLVQGVYCPDRKGVDLEVSVFDYDVEGVDDDEIVSVRRNNGETVEAFVTRLPVTNDAPVYLEDVMNAPVGGRLDEYRAIALSTAHITEADRDELAAAATDGDTMVLMRESGFFIKLYEETEDGDGQSNYRHGVSESIKQIIRWAYNAGYRMIEFDSDAPFLEGFQTYNW